MIATSKSDGTIEAIASYSPYGEFASGTTAPPTHSPFGYTGRQYDPETGLYQYRARYYSPRLGVFLSTDPVGTKDDPNLYGYVGLDPVNATDPTGACPTCIFGAVIGFFSQTYIEFRRNPNIADWGPRSYLNILGSTALGGLTGGLGGGAAQITKLLLVGNATKGAAVVGAEVVAGAVGGAAQGGADAAIRGDDVGTALTEGAAFGAIGGAVGQAAGAGARAMGAPRASGGLVDWQPGRLASGEVAGVTGEQGIDAMKAAIDAEEEADSNEVYYLGEYQGQQLRCPTYPTALVSSCTPM